MTREERNSEREDPMLKLISKMYKTTFSTESTISQKQNILT